MKYQYVLCLVKIQVLLLKNMLLKLTRPFSNVAPFIIASVCVVVLRMQIGETGAASLNSNERSVIIYTH